VGKTQPIELLRGFLSLHYDPAFTTERQSTIQTIRHHSL